jgi:ABC-2 type transport system permease protein
MSTHFAADTATLTGRSMRHIFRSPDTIITTAVTPIALMLLFVYVFGGALQTSTGVDNYVNYLLPGILLIAIASGIAYTAFRLYTDMQSGIFERFHSMPIARSSVLWAHVLTSLTANAITLAIIAGLSAKTLDGATAFSYPLIFLPFISSAFVPTETMPGPVRWFAENQPVTSIVDTIQALFAEEPVGTDIWVALAWCVGILIVAYVFAIIAYRKKVS